MARITLSDNKKKFFDFRNLSMQDEFIPVIKFDSSAINKYSIAAMVEGNNKITLSDKIDSDNRDITDTFIVIGPGDTKIPFKVEMGISSIDDDGFILTKIDSPVDGVIVKPDNPVKTKAGETFDLSVSVLKHQKFKSVIDFYANDDEDDLNKGEIKDVFCGRITVAYYPDVFTKRETESLVTEINYLKSFVEKGEPTEYAGSYCMAAAERGLSKLLNNTTDFYAVDMTHNKLNSINFDGKNANNRGATFKTNGYVDSTFDFANYQINMDIVNTTKNEEDVHSNAYLAVTLNKDSELFDYFNNSIKDKPGFHVYYLSITDAFHTLLLIIDNSISGNENYSIYDQHGKTSSYGDLSEIEKGFARQTSWTFLNFYIINGFTCGVKTKIWKIRRA